MGGGESTERRGASAGRGAARDGRAAAGGAGAADAGGTGVDHPALLVPRVVLVTDRWATSGRALVDVVSMSLDAGMPAVQLREKDLGGAALLALAERMRAATAARGALLLINDRVDVAVACGADGVHLGGGSMAVRDARALLPRAALVGVSTHDPADLAGCEADFALFGPVFDTPSKRAFGPPQGPERLAHAVSSARVPVLAIGGVTAAEAAVVVTTGAYGVAVIRAVLTAPDPAAVTRALLAALTPPGAAADADADAAGGPPARTPRPGDDRGVPRRGPAR